MFQKLIKILKWPSNPKDYNNHYSPLYIIVWRIFWILPIYFFLIITTLLVAISYGTQHAEKFFNNAKN